MRYYEYHNSDYITTFGIGENGGETISKDRYDALREAVANMPKDTETTTHRLKTDLMWEAVEIEQVDDPDIDDTDALNIILGETP